jgi:hypothetical protein
MSEVFKAIDNHVDKKYKEGLNNGIKQGQSGASFFILIVLVCSFVLYKYTKTHAISLNVGTQQTIAAQSTPAQNGELYTIPSKNVSIKADEIAEFSNINNNIDTKVEIHANIVGSTTNEPRKGIFQPKNPNIRLAPTK